MLKKFFGNFKYVLLASFFLLIPNMRAWAGGDFPIVNTASSSEQLYSLWDLRDGESFFQVTNKSDSSVDIHVQIFDATQNCAEFDFIDTLTPQDTHVYNVRNLDRNCATDKLGCATLAAPILDGDFGFAVVSEESDNDQLIGNFRIIHNAGFEYRANSAGIDVSGVGISNDENLFTTDYTFNFNDVNGTTFGDVYGISAGTDGPNVFAGPGEFVTPAFFFVELFDENENFISCPETSFSCVQEYGINQKLRSSDKGIPSLCLGTDPRGLMHLDVDFFGTFLTSTGGINFGAPDVFVGFVGLNNGAHSGTMDSWFAGPVIQTDCDTPFCTVP